MSTLKEKICFVTGATSGIGLATTRMLLEEGAKVFTLSRSADKIVALKKELGAHFDGLPGDVGDEKTVTAAFAACTERFGPLDVLLNNAGVGIPTPALEDASFADYQQMVRTNMDGVFLCVREALKLMKPRQSGQILTVISMAGQRTNPGAPLYCASKFGARGISGGLADQALKAGIKVTDINPGPVDSGYWGDRQVPREKFLKAVDVANTIRFILTVPEHMVVREINFDNIHWLAK